MTYMMAMVMQKKSHIHDVDAGDGGAKEFSHLSIKRRVKHSTSLSI